MILRAPVQMAPLGTDGCGRRLMEGSKDPTADSGL